MLQTAEASGLSPRQLSFTATLQEIAAHWHMIVLTRHSVAAQRIDVALRHVAEHTVGDRPDRVEPRAVKRRPKPHDLLTRPRDEARAA